MCCGDASQAALHQWHFRFKCLRHFALVTLFCSDDVARGGWEQSGTANWVDIQGRIMQQREDRPDLLREVSEGSGLASGRRMMGDHWEREDIR